MKNKTRLGNRWGAALVSVGLSAALAGCAGSDVSAGRESAGFNLSRCFGTTTDCSNSPPATLAAETLIRECADPGGGELADELVYPAASGTSTNEVLRVGPDGSVWLLRRAATGTGSGPSMAAPDPSGFELLLDHYTTDGTLLGTSSALVTVNESNHLNVSEDLSVDGAGHALVAVYANYAPNADSPFAESLTLHEFNGELEHVREPQLFYGVGQSQLLGGSGSSYVLAGNALENAAHGVLVRITDGQPDWIQTAVPSSGLGAGVGVSGVALNDAGIVSVLSQRSPRWEPGTADQFVYGVSRFDTSGNSVWDLKLSTAYTGGFPAAIAALGDGVAIAGRIDGFNTLLLRQVTGNGQLGWAFKLAAPSNLPKLQVDGASGRTIAATGNGIAVVASDGHNCQQFSVPNVAGRIPGFIADLAVASPYVYLLSDTIKRYRLPTE